MKITTVIPVFNTATWLSRCIDSVLAQGMDGREHEILLVDDGSSDGSSVICDRYAEAYPGRVRVCHITNSGVSVARNVGVAAARGEYIHFVDSDDRLLPGGYRYMLDNYPPYRKALILWDLAA
ncbi:MAG: glycosyltransferase [Bacteroides sp.]|nr:glycosyltransferase [Bacteroides sp.]MCM1095019.1 glycosyltransferase [Terasakiella sp.]